MQQSVKGMQICSSSQRKTVMYLKWGWAWKVRSWQSSVNRWVCKHVCLWLWPCLTDMGPKPPVSVRFHIDEFQFLGLFKCPSGMLQNWINTNWRCTCNSNVRYHSHSNEFSLLNLQYCEVNMQPNGNEHTLHHTTVIKITQYTVSVALQITYVCSN